MKIVLTLMTLICWLSSDAQLYKKFDVEFAYNYSVTLNRSELKNSTEFFYKEITRQSNAWLYNWNISMGYRFSNFYSLRIRYSRFNVGRMVNGNVYGFHGELLATFTGSYKDIIGNASIGFINEISYKLSPILLNISIGIDRNSYDYNNTSFGPFGMEDINYAFQYAIGVSKEIGAFFNPSIRFFSVLPIGPRMSVERLGGQGKFIPISYGLELALRFKFPE